MRNFFSISFIVLVSLIGILTLAMGVSGAPKKSMPPIFDGCDLMEPPLNLKYCNGYEVDFDINKHYPQLKKYEKKFKSKKYTYIRESWDGKPRLLIIERWYFQYPEDAVIFPKLNGMPYGNNAGPPIWGETVFGDKSLFIPPYSFRFVKNKALVRITIMSKLCGEDYLIKVAEKVIDKL